MNPSKELITRAAFDEFCNGPFSAALQLLSINMASTNQKLKQAASRALGYSCYEQLLAGWQRVEHIQHGLFLEYCKSRRATCIKAKNILMMFDTVNNRLIAVSLRPGEEGRNLWAPPADGEEYWDGELITEPNYSAATLELPVGATFDFDKAANAMRESVDTCLNTAPTETIRAAIEFQYPGEHGKTNKGFIELQRTGEGVIVDLYLTTDGDDCYDSIGVMFEDRQESMEGSDAVQLHLDSPVFGGKLGVYYQWLQPATDDAGHARLLHIEPNENFCISELQFDSALKAIWAIEDDYFSCGPNTMRALGGVLVKVTQEIIPSPY